MKKTRDLRASLFANKNFHVIDDLFPRPLRPGGDRGKDPARSHVSGSRIRTLSDNRHPAGRHTVIDGMMEVFGDRIAKISQIGRRTWVGGSPLSTVVVVVVVAATRP